MRFYDALKRYEETVNRKAIFQLLVVLLSPYRPCEGHPEKTVLKPDGTTIPPEQVELFVTWINQEVIELERVLEQFQDMQIQGDIQDGPEGHLE